jgi:hypothetical protein
VGIVDIDIGLLASLLGPYQRAYSIGDLLIISTKIFIVLSKTVLEFKKEVLEFSI